MDDYDKGSGRAGDDKGSGRAAADKGSGRSGIDDKGSGRSVVEVFGNVITQATAAGGFLVIAFVSPVSGNGNGNGRSHDGMDSRPNGADMDALRQIVARKKAAKKSGARPK